MDIQSKFLELTKLTYIYGTEHLLENHLPDGFKKDQFGNYYYKIGSSKTMFTCHLDTATTKIVKVKHLIKDNIISTNGKSILGADDKAGMTILLYMIEKSIPGLYYFFCGEEVGCIGSNAASTMDFSNYDRCISFDRRGYHSIITHQLGKRCCSEIFANSICEKLETKNLFYEPDPTGIVTDSAMFSQQIPECTNVSVGYFNEHTNSEFQDILFLKKLAQACVEIDWENLPVLRNTKVEDDSMNTWGPADEEYYETKNKTSSANIKVSINGEEYLATVKKSKVKDEIYFIENWISKSCSYTGFEEVQWDGKSCYLLYENSYREYIGEREELIHVIDNLSDITIHDLNIIKRI